MFVSVLHLVSVACLRPLVPLAVLAWLVVFAGLWICENLEVGTLPDLASPRVILHNAPQWFPESELESYCVSKSISGPVSHLPKEDVNKMC